MFGVGRSKMRVDELAALKDPIRTELVLYLAGMKAPKRTSYELLIPSNRQAHYNLVFDNTVCRKLLKSG